MQSMHDLKWTESEKKTARRLFEAALQQELSEVLKRFKEMAANAETADDMWAMESWLALQRREIGGKYNYRYSQLIIVFGNLLRERRITESELQGIGMDKAAYIKRVASL